MQPQPFHTGTAADRRTLLSVAVLMVLAVPSRASGGGAAMFQRDQHLVVVPASRGRPICGQNREDKKEVLVQGFQARMSN